MYIPKPFEERKLDRLHKFIEAYPLATWVSYAEGDLNVDHVPFVLDTSNTANGVLYGHIARANPIWRQYARSTRHVLVFRGPQTYVSPNWYPSKEEHGRAVPTWNYTIVTVYGRPRFIHDRNWLISHLSQLSDFNERAQSTPWSYSDAPAEFAEKLLKGVVGVEIPIEKIEGKFKANQTSTDQDKIGVIAGLREWGGDEKLAMAAIVEEHLKSDENRTE